MEHFLIQFLQNNLDSMVFTIVQLVHLLKHDTI